MTRTIVLIDGEHHPGVVRAALADAAARGAAVVGAVFLGGREKLDRGIELGVPVIVARDGPGWPSQRDALREGIAELAPEVVLDLSDSPIVDEDRRLRLASEALAAGVAYRGADFAFEVPPRPATCGKPSIAVIGSAKRAGKTAVGAFLARTLASAGSAPVVVAMGRGGPERPTIVRGDVARPSTAELLSIAAAGGHAASDFYEDAVLAGVVTVGARRAGAGLAGAPYHDNVTEAVSVASGLPCELIVLEGSGTAIPPVAADATVLVTRASDRVDRGFAWYRVLLADLVVVTMSEEPTVSPHVLSQLSSSLNEPPGRTVVRTVFRPIPAEPVRGETIFYATTAPEMVSERLVAYLETEHGAHVAGITHNLADREALSRDLDKAEGTYGVLLTELKAAAVDTAAARATAAGARVVFADNVPVPLGGDPDLGAALLDVASVARRRFERRAT